MRILIPTHAFTSNPQSGLHTVVWNTARSLAEAGHEVHILSAWTDIDTSDLPDSLHIHSVGNVRVHNLNRIVALRCFLAAIPLMVRKKFDWVYIPDTSRTPFHKIRFGAKLAVRLLAPQTPEVQAMLNTGDWRFDRDRKDVEEGWATEQKPLWYRLHGVLLHFVRRILYPQTVHAGADLVFCQGESTMRYWQEKLDKPTIQLANGIEESVFANAGSPPRKTDNVVFLFVGRIVMRKGIFTLLDAFKTLRTQHEDIELWIVGKGPEDLKEDMQNYCQADPEHIFYFGEVARPNIAPHFHHCSCVVDPMIYQGFSTVALEGLYCGKPVIASQHGGTADVVRSGENGVLFDSGEEGALYAAMNEVMKNKTTYQSTAEKQKPIIQKQYSWQQITKELIGALQSVE